MRPDYIDPGRKANVWAATFAPPPPCHNLTKALRRAFDVADPVPDEWDRLLSQIR